MSTRKWAICPDCRGEGMVVHPALSVWTAEDRAEDPDAFEAMMHGDYDQGCDRCGGSGKILVGGTAEREFRERLAEAKLRGLESGDPELYFNPRLGLS